MAHTNPDADATELELDRRLWGSKHTAKPALVATITRPASSEEGAVRVERGGGRKQAGEGARRTEAGAVGGEGRVAVDVLAAQDRGWGQGEINNLGNAAAMHKNLRVRDG